MALSTILKHLYDGSLTLSDGTGAAVTLAVPFDVGDVSVEGLQQTQREVTAYETRGVLNTVRHTKRSYPSGSFSVQLPEYMNSSAGNVVDFLMKTNGYSANVSTLVPTEVYAVDVILTTEGTDQGDAKDHVITMTDCACVASIAEGEPNTVNVSFTCYGTVTRS